MLVPIKEEETIEISGTKVLLVGGKGFLKQIEDEKVKYVVVRRPRTVLLCIEISYLPEKIQEMF